MRNARSKKGRKKRDDSGCLLRSQLGQHALAEHVKPGKQAIRAADRHRLEEESGRFTGSLDLDSATKAGAENECRWDYVVGIDVDGAKQVDCAEVHPATAGEVGLLIKKKTSSKPKLDAAGAKVSAWHWITTDSGPGFRRGGSEEQRLRSAGIEFPKRQLVV